MPAFRHIDLHRQAGDIRDPNPEFARLYVGADGTARVRSSGVDAALGSGGGLPPQWTDGGHGDVTATTDDPTLTPIAIVGDVGQTAPLLTLDGFTALAAALTDVILDTTTYDNPGGTGKLATIVTPGFEVGLAFAQVGDAFPRMLIVPGGIFLGDGTFDPYNGFQAGLFSNGLTITSFVASPYNSSITFEPDGTIFLSGSPDVNSPVVNIGDVNAVNRGLNIVNVAGMFGIGGASGPFFAGSLGTPTSVLQGGEVGDFYFRTDPVAGGEIIYRCTVAGLAGSATWVPILGQAAHVEPTAATPEAICNALIAAGLMAAS